MRNAISTTMSILIMLQISYGQPIYTGFTAFPALNSFSNQEDSWGVYNLNTANAFIVDDILDQRDRIGVVSTGTIFRENHFFAVHDMKNASNPSGQGGVLTSFDISYAGDLFSLSVDMGAMGNWDKSDRFKWSYRIDDGPVETAFELEHAQGASFTYLLVGGNVRLLNHPLEFLAPASLSGKHLSNKLRTYIFKFAPDTKGSKLYLYFTAESDGANEIYCFDNITLNAEKGSVVLEDGPEQSFTKCSVVVPNKIAIDEANRKREEEEEELAKRDLSFFYHYY